jgi:hypothetical protein
MKAGRKLGIGLSLLALNSPIGLGGMSICALLAAKTKIAMLYFVGIGIYGLSWVMLWIGLILTGSIGPRYMKILWKKGRKWIRALFKRNETKARGSKT